MGARSIMDGYRIARIYFPKAKLGVGDLTPQVSKALQALTPAAERDARLFCRTLDHYGVGIRPDGLITENWKA